MASLSLPAIEFEPTNALEKLNLFLKYPSLSLPKAV
jgi:hypothetical protein